MRQPEFWIRDELRSRIVRAALAPLGALYGATVALRAHFTKSELLPAKVVCVGGLTAGGSGKTPVAIAIARVLIARSLKVAFLTRGYGGRSRRPLLVDRQLHSAREVGDEPLLLAAVAPTVVSSDRRAGAALALAQGAQIIVMDDGHQNFQLKKDLSVVVLDGDHPFGNGRILPAGPLREPPAQGLARADAIVVIGSTPNLVTSAPVLKARICPTSHSDLKGTRLFAFAGIASPDRFFHSLRNIGADLAGTKVFNDHHPYTSMELGELVTAAREASAILITTEKDYVRLPPLERDPFEVFAVRAMFGSDLDVLLDKVAPRSASA